MSNIEQIEKRRRNILIHYTASFFVWGCAFAIMFSGIGQWSSTGRIILLAAMFGGVVYWLVQLLRLLRLQKLMHDEPNVAKVINDEFTQAAAKRAINLGFWVVLALQAVFIVVPTLGADVNLAFFPAATIIVGVVTVLGAALYFERE